MVEVRRLERFVNETHAAIAIPLVALAYAALATLAFDLFGAESIGASFFPPAGLTVALLFVAEYRRWPVLIAAFVLGEFVVDLFHDIPSVATFGFAAANVLEPLTGALILRRIAPSLLRLRRIDTFGFVMAAVIAGPLVGASIGATVVGLWRGSPWWETFSGWAVGDALGVLVVAPLVLVHLRDEVPEQQTRGVRSVVVFAVALVTLAVLLFVAERLPFGYLSIPVLAWAAFRFGARGVAYSGAWLAAVSTTATAFERGPWTLGLDADPKAQLLNQQSFWIAALAGAWFLALEIREREAVLAAHMASETERALTTERTAFENRRRGEAEALADVLLDLAKARTRREVAMAIYEHAVERYGVMGVTVSTASSAGELPGDVVWADAGGAVELGIEGVAAVGPLAEVTRTGVAILAEDPAMISERFVGVAVGVDHEKVNALACYPVRSGDQIAAVLFAWDEPHRFSPVESVDLAGLASVAGASYDRARLYDVESAIASSLQRALLAEPEYRLPGVEVSTRYLAATNLMEVGGDWYDVVPLDDGRVTFVIGDVVGKGLGAAAATGRLRGAARALALSFPPHEVLQLLDRLAGEDATSACATAAVVTLDPTTGRVSYSLAGHPGPLLRLPSGEVEVLDSALGPPLGAFGTAVRREAHVSIPPRSTIVMFTDGLVERRGELFDVGVERVVEFLRAAGSVSVRSLVDDLVEAGLEGVDQRDDIAVICATSLEVPDPDELSGTQDWATRDSSASEV